MDSWASVLFGVASVPTATVLFRSPYGCCLCQLGPANDEQPGTMQSALQLRSCCPDGRPPAPLRPPPSPLDVSDSSERRLFHASMSRRYALSHNPRVSAAAQLAARICNTHRSLGGSAATAKSRARQLFGSSRAQVRFLEKKAVTRTSGFVARPGPDSITGASATPEQCPPATPSPRPRSSRPR